MQASPALFREVHKHAWLHHVSGPGPGKLWWVVFCVHCDRSPYLEFYADAAAAAAHAPAWRQPLAAAVSVTAGLAPRPPGHRLLVLTPTSSTTLAAATREEMRDWVDTLANKLREMKILGPRENLYTRAPELLPPRVRAPTRDPTSPLPPPPTAAPNQSVQENSVRIPNPSERTHNPPSTNQNISGSSRVSSRRDQSTPTGSPNIASGSPIVVSGSPNIASSTPIVVTGSQNIASGSQNIATGSQNVVTGNQNVAIVSQCSQDVFVRSQNTPGSSQDNSICSQIIPSLPPKTRNVNRENPNSSDCGRVIPVAEQTPTIGLGQNNSNVKQIVVSGDPSHSDVASRNESEQNIPVFDDIVTVANNSLLAVEGTRSPTVSKDASGDLMQFEYEMLKTSERYVDENFDDPSKTRQNKMEEAWNCQLDNLAVASPDAEFNTSSKTAKISGMSVCLVDSVINRDEAMNFAEFDDEVPKNDAASSAGGIDEVATIVVKRDSRGYTRVLRPFRQTPAAQPGGASDANRYNPLSGPDCPDTDDGTPKNANENGEAEPFGVYISLARARDDHRNRDSDDNSNLLPTGPSRRSVLNRTLSVPDSVGSEEILDNYRGTMVRNIPESSNVTIITLVDSERTADRNSLEERVSNVLKDNNNDSVFQDEKQTAVDLAFGHVHNSRDDPSNSSACKNNLCKIQVKDTLRRPGGDKSLDSSNLASGVYESIFTPYIVSNAASDSPQNSRKSKAFAKRSNVEVSVNSRHIVNVNFDASSREINTISRLENANSRNATAAAGTETTATVQDTNVIITEPNATVRDTNVNVVEPNVTVRDTNVTFREPNATVRDTNVNIREPNATVRDVNVNVREPNAPVRDTNVIIREPNATVRDINVNVREPNSIDLREPVTISDYEFLSWTRNGGESSSNIRSAEDAQNVSDDAANASKKKSETDAKLRLFTRGLTDLNIVSKFKKKAVKSSQFYANEDAPATKRSGALSAKINNMFGKNKNAEAAARGESSLRRNWSEHNDRTQPSVSVVRNTPNKAARPRPLGADGPSPRRAPANQSEAKSDRRRSNSLSSANIGSGESSASPSAPLPAPSKKQFLSLREQQVRRMRTEQAHDAGVRLLLRAADKPDHAVALVDAYGAVWVAGWKQRSHPLLYNALHIGDRLVSVNGSVVTCARAARKALSQGQGQVELIIKRVPHGRIFALKRDADKQDLGLLLEGPTFSGLVADSVAHRAGVPGSGTLTEVNGRPLNLLMKKGDSQVRDRLNSVGRDVSVLIQPAEFVSLLRSALKAVRGHKDYIVQ